MSEEMNQQNEPKKQKSNVVLVILVIISLLMSIASLTISLIGPVHIQEQGQHQDRVSITKKYDKGQSFEKAMKKKKPTVVFFYVNWCGFCQRFAPTFAKISKDRQIRKDFAIAYVNCEDQENAKLMEEYQIQGFPTVYLVNGEEKTHIDNSLMFTDDPVKDVKDKLYEVIKK